MQTGTRPIICCVDLLGGGCARDETDSITTSLLRLPRSCSITNTTCLLSRFRKAVRTSHRQLYRVVTNASASVSSGLFLMASRFEQSRKRGWPAGALRGNSGFVYNARNWTRGPMLMRPPDCSAHCEAGATTKPFLYWTVEEHANLHHASTAVPFCSFVATAFSSPISF